MKLALQPVRRNLRAKPAPPNLSTCVHYAPIASAVKYRPSDAKRHANKPFRMNTCESVSKQRTLTTFRINTYEKQGGRGVSNTPRRASAVTCATWRLYPLYPHSIAHTSCHHGGVPLRKLVRCTEAQKCLSVSPLFATLTHSLSRKSFPCHSYANTRDEGATVAPVSAPLSPFAVACATWHLYPLCPHSIAHTSRHHGGVRVCVATLLAWRGFV